MEPKPLTCPHCGARLDEEEHFCPDCGADVTIHPAPRNEPVKAPEQEPKQKPETEPTQEAEAKPEHIEVKGGLYLAVLLGLMLGNLLLSGLPTTFILVGFKVNVLFLVLIALIGLLFGWINLSVLRKMTADTRKIVLGGIIAPLLAVMLIIGGGLIAASISARVQTLNGPGSNAMIMGSMLAPLTTGIVMASSLLYYVGFNILFIRLAIRKKELKTLAWYALAVVLWGIIWIVARKVMMVVSTTVGP